MLHSVQYIYCCLVTEANVIYPVVTTKQQCQAQSRAASGVRAVIAVQEDSCWTADSLWLILPNGQAPYGLICFRSEQVAVGELVTNCFLLC